MKTLPLNFTEDDRFMLEFWTRFTLHKGKAYELQDLHVTFWRERIGDKEMLDIRYDYYMTPKGRLSSLFPGVFSVAIMSDFNAEKNRFDSYKELDLEAEYDIKDIADTVKLLKGF